MFLRKVVSWPSRMHDAANSADGSQHGSRHGASLFRRSASMLNQTEFDCSFKPERIVHAVYHDEQRVIEGILAAGGTQEVRGAMIWRVSKQTIEKLYARGCCDQDFINNLFSAASFGRPQMLDALLDHTGLTVHTLKQAGHYRSSLLYAAARAGHSDIVKRLLERGAAPHVGRFTPGFLGRKKYHTTPLEAAVRGGYAPVVRQILQTSPASPRELQSLLDIAIHEEARTCCQALIQYGAKPQAEAQQRIVALGDPLLMLSLQSLIAK
jgi:hypothetical protein